MYIVLPSRSADFVVMPASGRRGSDVMSETAKGNTFPTVSAAEGGAPARRRQLTSCGTLRANFCPVCRTEIAARQWCP